MAGGPASSWVFSDRLRLQQRVLPQRLFDGLQGKDLALEQLRLGFLDGALPPVLWPVADRPALAGDTMFWQFPCRTEGAAWQLHRGRPARRQGLDLHVYLGLPWATWLDLRRREPAMPASAPEFQWQRVRLQGLHGAVQEAGGRLRVHTVCQHVAWADLLPAWVAIGVTDVWLSHLPCRASGLAALHEAGLQGHPWRLFAVNVEDPERRTGLATDRDPAQRRWLASFVGAHAPHYPNDVRLRLQRLAAEPDIHVQVREGWHFEQAVYGHQVAGEPLAPPDDSIRAYNTLLTDSVFALCPSGAGPNTLRLWEALAAGTVPVLLGDVPVLPAGGTLAPVDWASIVLQANDDELDQLPQRLRAMPMNEVRQRRALGLEAFARVQQQCCF